MKSWHAMPILVLVIVFVTIQIQPTFGANSLIVKTDKMFYKYGDTVTISGIGQNSNLVTMIINEQRGFAVTIVYAQPSPSGNFSVSFKLQGTLMNETGLYTIIATQNQNSAYAVFFESQLSSQPVTANFTNPQIVDSFGNKLSSVNTNQQIQIAANVANLLNVNQQFTYFVNIVNGGGYQVSNSWITGTLTAGQSLVPAQSWTPSSAGSYTAQLYLLTNMSYPVQLAPSISVPITVNGTTSSTVSFGYSNSTVSFGYSNSTIVYGYSNSTALTVVITSGSGSSPSCSSTDNCFVPSSFNVLPRTTISWKNADNVAHTVTSGYPGWALSGTEFDSGLIPASGTFSHMFSSNEKVFYFCSIHPWMTGSIMVGHLITAPVYNGPITSAPIPLSTSTQSTSNTAVPIPSSTTGPSVSNDVVPPLISKTNTNTAPSTNAPNSDLAIIEQWAGYSMPHASDSQLLESMGIKATHVPSWSKHVVNWVISEDISKQDFLNTINYLYKSGIVR